MPCGDLGKSASSQVLLLDLLADEPRAIRIGPFGSALKKHEYSDAGIRVLGIDDVLSRGSPRKPKFIPEEKYRELSQYRVRPGDILVTNMGTVGKAFLVPPDFETAIISSHLIKVTPDLRRVDANYLERALNDAPAVIAQIANDSRGAIMAGFNTSRLKQLRIPLPTLEEQRRIVAILDQVDALRAKRRSAIAQLDSLTQAIFVDMFGSPAANPKGYPVAMMIELVDPKRPITYGILKPGDDVPEGVPYVRVVDMTDRSIRSAGLRRTTEAISLQYKRSLLRQGDLLLSIRGQVGRLAMVEADVDGANITQDTARLAITGANPIYVLECLRTPELQGWMKTFTKGAAVRGINLTDVKKIQTPLPPASDQSNFAQVANAIQRNRQSLLLSAWKLDLLFASLQHRAFRADL